MITFDLTQITAISNAQILENGDTKQNCMLEIKINGIVAEKILTDVVEFIIPNNIMAGSPTPILTGWEYIKNTLAPEWVAVNYAEI